MKKDKNLSVQISLYSIFDQLGSIQHLRNYKNCPSQLAQQISDLKVLVQFAASNYTSKARTILNLSKQFPKTVQTAKYAVYDMDFPLLSLPQTSYPELAYEALKRSTKLQLQQEQSQQLDWRAVLTEFQLKFLESKNIFQHLRWQTCYNSQERCIKIVNDTGIWPHSNGKHHGEQKKNNSNPLQIQLGLKIQEQLIVWHIKKVQFHKNSNFQLLNYYRNELMPKVRQMHNGDINQSQKHVLAMLYNSIEYADIILLYLELKNMSFNKDVSEVDSKNAILNLFDEKQTAKHRYLIKRKIKVCFLLAFSHFPPTIILRFDDLNLLKIQLTKTGNLILKVKLKDKLAQNSQKRFSSTLRKIKFSPSFFIQIVHEVAQCLFTYQNFMSEKLQKYKLDIFNPNSSTHCLVFLKSLNSCLLQQHTSQNQQISLKIKQSQAKNHIFQAGLYLVFYKPTILANFQPMVTFVSHAPDFLLKTPSTEPGFINKMLKQHPSISFQEALLHIYFLQAIQEAQNRGDWAIKLVYADIYREDDPTISYMFKQILKVKQKTQNNFSRKGQYRSQQSSHPSSNANKDFSIYLRISQHFKDVSFIFASPIHTQDRKNDMHAINKAQMNGRGHLNRPNESPIPDKYFKDTWRKYMKQKNESQSLKNQYLDIDQLLKATYYILNHLQFNRYVKGKSGIFKNEEMIQLMDH